MKCYSSLFCHFEQIIRCLSLSDCFCTGIIQIIPTWYLWAKPLRSSNYSHLAISEDLVQPFNIVWEYYCPEQFFSLMQCIIMSMWIWSRGGCGDGEETGWREFYTTINYFYPKARHFGKIFTLTRKQGHQWSNLIRGKVWCWLTMPSCSLRAHSWGEKVQPYILSCCVLKVLLFEEVLKKFIFLKVWCMHSFTSFNRTALT